MFKTLKGHSNEVFWCCWSPDGKLLASAGVGKSVLVWDMVNYELVRSLAGHHHNVSACEFSPDGAILATASFDTRVILWDPYTGMRPVLRTRALSSVQWRELDSPSCDHARPFSNFRLQTRLYSLQDYRPPDDWRETVHSLSDPRRMLIKFITTLRLF